MNKFRSSTFGNLDETAQSRIRLQTVDKAVCFVSTPKKEEEVECGGEREGRVERRRRRRRKKKKKKKNKKEEEEKKTKKKKKVEEEMKCLRRMVR